jgi:signal transduction histidine kinase
VLRERPTKLDWFVAAAVLLAAEAEVLLGDIGPMAASVPLSVVASVALAFRRVAPALVVALCIGSTATATWAGVPANEPVLPIVWIFLSVYSVAAYCSLGRAVLGLVIGLSLFASTLVTYSEDTLFGIAIIGAPWLVGRAMRSRTGEATELADRVADLESSRERELEQAAEAERARIARDLHDVISHAMSAMVVQAGAAQQVLTRDPRGAADALERIQLVGRDALQEMGALVGLLREEGGRTSRTHPGLADLSDLVDRSRDAGVAADLVVVGAPRPVSTGLQLSVYRVVQEALTNTRKHSRSATAHVRLTYTPDELLVDVVDDGIATGEGMGNRLGTVGMVERMAAYGGTVDSGPTATGGWAVRARVPLGGDP